MVLIPTNFQQFPQIPTIPANSQKFFFDNLYLNNNKKRNNDFPHLNEDEKEIKYKK